MSSSSTENDEKCSLSETLTYAYGLCIRLKCIMYEGSKEYKDDDDKDDDEVYDFFYI